MLLGAKDNEVLPPVTASSGVDLYAVCGRKSADEGLKAKATQELQMKQLDIFAQRHLRSGLVFSLNWATFARQSRHK